MATKRTQKDILLVYNFVNKDYKSISDGKHKIMYFHPKEGTVLGPIESMPESIFNSYLEMAKKKK